MDGQSSGCDLSDSHRMTSSHHGRLSQYVPSAQRPFAAPGDFFFLSLGNRRTRREYQPTLQSSSQSTVKSEVTLDLIRMLMNLHISIVGPKFLPIFADCIAVTYSRSKHETFRLVQKEEPFNSCALAKRISISQGTFPSNTVFTWSCRRLIYRVESIEVYNCRLLLMSPFCSVFS